MSKHRKLAEKICQGLGIELGECFDKEEYEDSVYFVEHLLNKVESDTWAAAANTVENQFGVSHWTEEDTVQLLMEKSKTALKD